MIQPEPQKIHLLCAQTLTQADRHADNAGTTEFVIPAYAFIPKNAMPQADSQTSRDRAAMIDWTLHGFSNVVAGGAGDTITFKLYAGATPGDTGTATSMWAAPPTFTIPRNARQAFRFNFQAIAQRTPSTTIYSYTVAEFWASPSSTVNAAVQSTWTWDPASQGNSLIGLRDGPYYLWLTATFSANSGTGTVYTDYKTTVVLGYGLNI